jgi:succinate-semialdehyde dehydrogenase/glutarate-semialdehyde dehydrogenase
VSERPLSDPEREQQLIKAIPTGLFIAGRWREASDGATFSVEDPATGHVLTQVSDASPADALSALSAAAATAAGWGATPPRERGEILRRAFDLLIARSEDFALCITLEMGKPLADARAEVAYAAEFFRWFAEESVRIDGRYTVAPGGGGRLLVMRQPVGPCLLITPWNFPIAMGTRKIGPAIAAGCTMICKPAELTPLSMLLLTDLLVEAGLPPGVLNVVTTTQPADVTRPVLADPRLRKLSFTGSTAVGRDLVKLGADNLLRMSMELGGNAPFVVFEDADLEAAVEGAVVAKMRNMGEACTSANRFHVHRSVVSDFAARLAERLAAMKVGRGTVAGVEVGPLVEERQRRKVVELVGDAIDRGARVLTGGRALDGPGYFYEPTVLADVAVGANLLREEIFGPVAPIVAFDDEREAIAAANDTNYGLVAYVYTQGLDRALRVCESLETGMVGLNQGLVSNPAAPFGGVKHSGFGREGGREGIAEYLETKYVAVHQA